MNETWERESLPLHELIQLDNFKIISNVHQRSNRGGRSAIFASEENFSVKNLNDVVQVPLNVEAVWALLTPHNVTTLSPIKKIVVGAIYSKPRSRKKTVLLDHISQTYHLLSAKYGEGTQFLISGDTNDLKLDQILSLSPRLTQVVQVPTRHNPDRMLDPVITTLCTYYQPPYTILPLDADPDSNGKPSDHDIVIMHPINSYDNRNARKSRQVTFRPLPSSGVRKMGEWITQHNWKDLYNAENVANARAYYIIVHF